MVDDPSAHPDLFTTEGAQEKERKRLFKIIEDLASISTVLEMANAPASANQCNRDLSRWASHIC
jgi:hypothetical protein